MVDSDLRWAEALQGFRVMSTVGWGFVRFIGYMFLEWTEASQDI
jgi:hypothetical protein